jgi:hypothetical protein
LEAVFINRGEVSTINKFAARTLVSDPNALISSQLLMYKFNICPVCIEDYIPDFYDGVFAGIQSEK